MCLGGILLEGKKQVFVPLTLEQSLKLSVHRSGFHSEKPDPPDRNTLLCFFAQQDGPSSAPGTFWLPTSLLSTW